jgi:hypothetical protein
VGDDDHGEAYTVIVWGVGFSHEIPKAAGAEAVMTAKGNMRGADMRGTVALSGSEATSRTIERVGTLEASCRPQSLL